MTGFSWPSVLGPLAAGADIGEDDARTAMAEVMAGRADPAQIAAFIVSLRAKGETVDEMVGLVRAMYDAAVTVDVGVPVVDTAGTGGDASGTFNISTTAAFVAAGAGLRVAKHGNRAASSRAGSADVLEELGVPIELEPDDVARSIRETGFGFFFAPRFHPAMRHAVPVRRALGIPTVFNFLGPLANPARAESQVIGVADARMVERMVRVLQRLGRGSALVFHGHEGLDELSLDGVSTVFRLQDGEVTQSTLDASDLGLVPAGVADLAGGDAARNAELTRAVLSGEPGPRRDIAVLNAAAALVAGGAAADFPSGVERAVAAIDGGSAAEALDAAADFR